LTVSPRPRRLIGLAMLLIATLLAASGVALLGVQVAQWLDTGRWTELPLLELIHTPVVKSVLPASFLSWLSRPRSLYGLHAPVLWFLETVPAWLFLGGVGGSILWCVQGR
jgi:hypothetical protein